MTLEEGIKKAIKKAEDRSGDAAFRAFWAVVFSLSAMMDTCHIRKEVKDLRMLLASEKKVENVYGSEAPETYFARPDGLRTYVLIDGMPIAKYQREHEGFDIEQLPYAAQ